MDKKKTTRSNTEEQKPQEIFKSTALLQRTNGIKMETMTK
jgi:hypothetical protein